MLSRSKVKKENAGSVPFPGDLQTSENCCFCGPVGTDSSSCDSTIECVIAVEGMERKGMWARVCFFVAECTGILC